MAQSVDITGAGTVSVNVNGVASVVRAGTLEALLADLGYAEQKVATAVNGEFVAARRRAQTLLRAGDEIEIVAPQQGG